MVLSCPVLVMPATVITERYNEAVECVCICHELSIFVSLILFHAMKTASMLLLSSSLLDSYLLHVPSSSVVDAPLLMLHQSLLSAGPAELDMPELDEDVAVKLSSRVILFNDEWHTFEEVIEQIIKATGCSFDKAEDLTWEVHNSGKAMVFEGDMGDCLRVSNVLEEIKLRTQIEC